MTTFLGILFGVILLAVAYGATMAGYFTLRRRMPGAKFFVEIVIMGVAVTFSFAVKLTVYLLAAQPSFAEGVASVFFAIYKAAAGLTLDGIDSVAELGALVNCLYSGAALYAILVFLSVISAKASYEAYSFCALVLTGLTMKNGTDYYFFMTATDDALRLADSIAERDCYKKGKGSPARRCVIVFSGDGIGMFDRKNQLHREIMARGYYYWDFDKVAFGHEKSLLSRLHLRRNNVAASATDANTKWKYRDVQYSFFALGLSPELTGSESSNADLVYDEISLMTDEVIDGKPLVIASFYFMVDSEINYEVYKRRMLEISQRFAEKYDRPAWLEDKVNAEVIACTKGKTYDSEDANKVLESKKSICESLLSRFALLYAFSEAKLAVRSMTAKRTAILCGTNGIGIKANAGSDGEYKVMSLGFGKTGQLALCALFTDTAYVDDKGNQPQFRADVFDLDADAKAGLFSTEHPMFLCAFNDRDPERMTRELFDEKTRLQRLKIARRFAPALDKFNSDNGTCFDFGWVEDRMRFPQIEFHSASCFDPRFFDLLEGEGKKCMRKSDYDAYIIALGKDELNIAMVNALLDDFKHEKAARLFGDATRHVTIFVNVRDNRNICRVSWDTEDVKAFDGSVNVIVFGEADDMYSYRNIADVEEDKRYNYAYSLLGGYNVADKEVSEIFKAEITPAFSPENADNDMSQNVVRVMQELDARISGGKTEMNELWASCSMMDRESNYGARRFADFFAEVLAKADKKSGKLLVRLSETEHVRWCRLHMSYGWTFDCDKLKRIKEHSLLCPSEMLTLPIRANDTINVLLGYLNKLKKHTPSVTDDDGQKSELCSDR